MVGPFGSVNHSPLEPACGWLRADPDHYGNILAAPLRYPVSGISDSVDGILGQRKFVPTNEGMEEGTSTGIC